MIDLKQGYDRRSFCQFLRSFIDDYSEYVEEIQYEYPTKFASKLFRLGQSSELEMDVYEIHHDSTNDARVGIAQDAFKVLLRESMHNRALVVFIPENSEQWRLSLLQIEATMDDKSSRIKRGFSNPRRHSYLLGRDAHTKTPEQYIIGKGPIRAQRVDGKDLTAWEDLQRRFSVEALTKEFYDQLYHWYLWAVEPSTGVTFPNLVNTSQDDRDDIAIKIIRLITRLLFVWFIKQKKLVPEQIFDEAQLDKILANFDPQSEKDGKYYNAILQNLFFATLNNEVNKRRFMTDPFQGKSDSFGVKQLFRDSLKASWFKISHDEVIALFHHVPFMNCGLFECLDKYAKSDIGQENDLFLDGFSSRDSSQDGHLKYRAFVPNRLFFAEEHYENVTVEEKGQTKTDSVKVMGLIRLLKLYNFTVQENTPAEVEVSLDPELLGQVFENLLAAYNPETKESARKSTGSFYTPRPIVEYMVNESLVAYLKTKVGPQMEPIYRSLISYEDTPEEMLPVEKKRIAILNALYECKILDPACGSGAFPMGMLQQMVHITRKLDSEFDPYLTKLRIIDNCIYGSDIQPIAMLISKLRFFISLICEQDESRINFNDPENNFGINTLPNLETKFVAANSLLKADVRNYAKDECWEDPQLVILKNELLDIRERHFAAKTQRTKLRLREEDEKKREEIRQYILENAGKPDPVLLQMYEDRIKHLTAERRMYEGENIVEEVVNTQASLFEDAQPQVVRKDVNKIQRDKIDAEIASLRRSITKEQNKRNPVGFNAAIQQVTKWNPYDQIKAAPFFDSDWMFGVNNGFDIVIGNPPYFQVSKGIYSATQFPYSEGKDTGKQNMYKLFVEHSYNSAKNNGIACMIVQSSLMCDMSSMYTRELLLRHTCLEQMIEFPKTAPTPAGQVFASVCQGTCIYLLRKAEPNRQSFMLSVNNDCTTISTMQKEYILQDALMEFYPEDMAIPMLKPNEFEVLRKIKTSSTPLSTLLGSIAQGDINLTTSKDQISSNSKNSVLLLRGRHVESFIVHYEEVDEYVPKNYKRESIQDNQTNQYIVCQEISGTVDPRRIHTALTDPSKEFICGHTINKILLSNSRLNYYIMGLLNSTLMDWVFRKTSSNNHVGGYELKQLPIIVAGDIKPIERIVKAIISSREKNEDTSKFEAQLDDEVFALYGIEGDDRELIVRNYA